MYSFSKWKTSHLKINIYIELIFLSVMYIGVLCYMLFNECLSQYFSLMMVFCVYVNDTVHLYVNIYLSLWESCVFLRHRYICSNSQQ